MIFRATSKAPVPLSRMTATAERPGGVASAVIGSVSIGNYPARPRPKWLGLPLRSLRAALGSSGLYLHDGLGGTLLPLAGQQPLLRDAGDIADRIIQVQARGEVEKKEGHHYGHHVEHHLHLRIGLHPNLPYLAEPIHRKPHHHGDDVQRVRTREVREPEKRGAPQLDRVLKHEKERKEHRHWQEHGPAATQRIDAMLLIELEHFLLDLLRVVLVLLLNLLHQWLDGLELHVGSHCLLIQWPEQQSNQYSKADQDQPIRQVQVLVHPDQQPAHPRCERTNNRAKARPAIRIDVIKAVPDSSQAIVLHGSGVDRVAEVAARTKWQAEPYVGARGSLLNAWQRAGCDTTDATRGAVQRQHSGHEVFRFDGGPF